MLKIIIAEIVTYEQVAKNPKISEDQRQHARLMAAGLCVYLSRVHQIDILEIIAMVEAQNNAEQNQ
jgi:hypothetical protein